MVRVDLGLDPKTGEQLYTRHSRRAQLASGRALLPVFRRSAIAGRLRVTTRVERRVNSKGRIIRKGREGVKVGWRHFARASAPASRRGSPPSASASSAPTSSRTSRACTSRDVRGIARRGSAPAASPASATSTRVLAPPRAQLSASLHAR
eukprot:7017915-Prymnesium_polylepis.1